MSVGIKSPEERFRGLKKRREELIAASAALEERKRQNNEKYQVLVKEVTALGLTEDNLDESVLKLEKKFEEEFQKCEDQLVAEEEKVRDVNLRLAQG